MNVLSKKYYPLLIFILLGYISSMSVNAQNPRLNFLTKRATVGQDIKISLVFDHPSNKDVFFPNHLEVFKPFELIKSDFFPTYTTDTISTDSLVYTLRTFNVEKSQTLILPVWIISGADSIVFWSNTDTLSFSELIQDSVLDNLKVVSAIPFIEKEKETKVPIINIIILISILGIGLLGLIFQNKIKKQVLVYQFQEKQKQFNKKFLQLMKSDLNPTNLQKVMTLWRNQMTWVEEKPFDTLSSVEIEKASSQTVGQAVREIETSLFGGQNSERIPVALQILFSYSKERFRERRLIYKNQLKSL